MDQSQICAENCRRLNELTTTVAEETGANDIAHKAMEHRLDVLEEGYKQQNNILVTLQKQADAIESMNGKIDNIATSVNSMSTRITDIEKEPGENWKKMGFEIVKYIVIAGVGAAIAFIFGGMA